jgi:putative ABC transport system permease protein
MAVGASPAAIVRLVVGQGAVVAVAGVAIGLAGALAFSRLIEGLLFGVAALDPITFVIAPLGLGLVAVLAGYLPARRAARIDPTIALRAE